MGPSFVLLRIRSVPLRIHWSAPLGALAFGGFSPASALAWLGIVSVHEIGHALLAWRYGRGVTGLSVHAFGGECEWIPGPHPFAREIVAWGGVLGQFALVAIVALGCELFPLREILGERAVNALVIYNLFVAAFNLLPLGNLDGSRAWRLFRAFAPSNVRRMIDRQRRSRAWGESRALRRKLEQREARPGPFRRR